MEERQMQMGQVWVIDRRECLLLGKIGRDWFGLTLNRAGHSGESFKIDSRLCPGYNPEIEYIPQCFYWVIPRYASFVAENLPEYFKKISRRKTRPRWNSLWI